MIKDRDFLENKKKILQKLENAKNNGEVDSGILPILDLINSLDEYYTSSSCYGRVVLLEIPVIGDKKNAKWLGKWHHKIKSDDVFSAVKDAKKGQLWLLAQSPIIHVVCKDVKSADKLLKLSVSCGFKHSGLKSVDRKIVVEVLSTERLDAPVGRDGSLFCDEEYLGLLVDVANDVISKSIGKLSRFEDGLNII
jgi:tRNA wybutosine-synthesizing protein 3